MSSKILDSKKNNKILVFGVFDLLHPGHRYFLRQAQKLGQQLIVVVTRDHIVAKQKGHRPIQPLRKRISALKKLKFVNKIVLGQRSTNHKYSLVKKIKPHIICLGYDQPGSVKKIKVDLRRLKLNTNVIRLKSFFPGRYKSSLRRVKIKS